VCAKKPCALTGLIGKKPVHAVGLPDIALIWSVIRRAIQRNQQNNDALRTEQALQINPILARLIESRLAQLGFDPGNVDGRFNRDTRRAISRYQSNRNLPSTGYISEPTLARLLADTFR